MREQLTARSVAFAVFSCAAAFALSSWGQVARAQSLPTNFVSEIVVPLLAQPTSLAFLPDGRVLITEQRTGKVRMLVNGHVASTDPVVTVPQLASAGNEQGLLAIAIDPGWPDRPYVYLYHNRTGNRLRLVRYEAGGDLSNPAGENLTLAKPYLIIDDIPDAATNHNGGSLRFGPDGKLYLSMGEDADPCAAQDSTTLKGEILRLDVSGLPAGAGGPAARAAITPTDNPLQSTNANAKLVFAYGLRNPFRFHIDSVTGLLYVADVGDATWEEMDEVRGGDNLGWPYREGNLIRVPGTCLEPGGSGAGAYKTPIATYSHTQGRSIIGGGIYRPPGTGTALWPQEYWGNVFYADYYTGFVRRLKQTTGVWGPAAAPGQPNGTDWAISFKSPVDFMVGPDGSLYWLSQFDASFGSTTGSLNRIRYTGPAVGVASAAPHALTLTARPSPFRTETVLSFALAAPGEVRLTIYDVSGREVRLLLSGSTPRGASQVRWDGADASGRSVPVGVYLARLEDSGVREVVRLLRLP